MTWRAVSKCDLLPSGLALILKFKITLREEKNTAYRGVSESVREKVRQKRKEDGDQVFAQGNQDVELTRPDALPRFGDELFVILDLEFMC